MSVIISIRLQPLNTVLHCITSNNPTVTQNRIKKLWTLSHETDSLLAEQTLLHWSLHYMKVQKTWQCGNLFLCELHGAKQINMSRWGTFALSDEWPSWMTDRVSFQRHGPLFHSTERCPTSIVYIWGRKWFIIHIEFTQNALQNLKTSIKAKTQLIWYPKTISMFHRRIKYTFQGKSVKHVHL